MHREIGRVEWHWFSDWRCARRMHDGAYDDSIASHIVYSIYCCCRLSVCYHSCAHNVPSPFGASLWCTNACMLFAHRCAQFKWVNVMQKNKLLLLMAVCDDLQTSWFVRRLWLCRCCCCYCSSRVWFCAPVAIPQTPSDEYTDISGVWERMDEIHLFSGENVLGRPGLDAAAAATSSISVEMMSSATHRFIIIRLLQIKFMSAETFRSVRRHSLPTPWYEVNLEVVDPWGYEFTIIWWNESRPIYTPFGGQLAFHVSLE